MTGELPGNGTTDSDMTGPDSAEVLVVGAGPTGLLVAGELAHRHVPVRIVERASRPSDLSRALVIHARTLETLDLLGRADEFLRRGYPAPGLDIGLVAGRPVSVEMRSLKTRFPFMLVLPQQETEEILEEHLEAGGVAVERGKEFVDLRERPDGRVESQIRGADGAAESITSRYVVGCDGAHSDVRQVTGLPFEGQQQDAVVFLADVKIEGEFVKSRLANFTSERGFVSILPFLGEYARVFAADFTKQDIPETEELQLADLQDTLDAVVARPVEMSDPRWLTRFRSPTRQVPVNRSGSVFLAGDSAHAHSPAGGQGMNVGLQDAVNLSWKMAMVVREEAPAALLDTYDAERHPVDARVQKATDLMFRSFVMQNPVLKRVRDVAASALVPLPPVQRRLAGGLSGLDVDYGFTDLSRKQADGEVPRGAVQAGARAPDAELWQSSGPPVRLYELLRHRQYLLVIFASARHLIDDRASFARFVAGLSEIRPAAATVAIVLDEGVPGQTVSERDALVDYKNQFRSGFGVEHGSVVLVRPDGHVGFHRGGFDLDGISRALAEWATAPRPEHLQV